MELAANYGKGPMLLKDISKNQDISFKYLGQLVIALKIAGLLKSACGRHGGYFLSRSPDKIRLIEILKASEGSLYLAECIESPDICHRSKDCVARLIWEKASRAFMDVLSSITLNDMIEANIDRQKENMTDGIKSPGSKKLDS